MWDAYAYTNRNSYGDANGDANLHARRRTWAVDAGCAGSD